MFAGWGRLRYFDLAERQIGSRTTLANIPKVGTQWKVIHDNVGKHFISLSFAGVEVIRAENYITDDIGHEDLMDMQIELSESDVQIPGFEGSLSSRSLLFY